jgi:putative aldouronate transport system permease protein
MSDLSIISRGNDGVARRAWRQRGLLLLVLPGLAWMLVFNYVPMYGVVMAFQDFDPFKGYFRSPWVGLAVFKELFADSFFWSAVWNTLLISGLKLLIGFPLPIAFALLLNELPGERYKKAIQTISYLPYFISWVFVVAFMYVLLAPGSGFINVAVAALGLGDGAHFFLGEAGDFVWLAVGSDIWKNLGWNSVIFIASIAGIDPQLYEAAIIDGAGRWRRITSITLPAIKPTIIVLLILNVSYLVTQNFDQMYLMQNPLNQEASEIINTYAYRNGIMLGRYSYGTAIGLFQAVISLALLVASNVASRRATGESLY